MASTVFNKLSRNGLSGEKSINTSIYRMINRYKHYDSIKPSIIPSIKWNGDLLPNALDLESFGISDNEFKSQCHWVIPNKFMMGQTPNINDQSFMFYLVNDIEINKFITLTEDSIRNNLKNLVNHLDIEYIHFPIIDFTVADDESTYNLMELLINKLCIDDINKLYCHCYSGHGRAGTISSLLLQCIYGMDAEISLKYLKIIHNIRCNNNYSCHVPEKEIQIQQIKRLNPAMMKLYDTYKDPTIYGQVIQ